MVIYLFINLSALLLLLNLKDDDVVFVDVFTKEMRFCIFVQKGFFLFGIK